MSREAEEILRVIDGDTVTGTSGRRHRVLGIDTPELGQVGGAEAAAILDAAAAAGATVRGSGKRDAYGRELSDVTLPDGRDYAFNAVRQGAARPYNKDSDMEAAQVLGALDAYKRTSPSNPRLAAAYKNAAYGETFIRDKNQLASGTFGTAVARGGQQMQAGLYGFMKVLGDAADIDLISEWGEEGMARNLREAAMNPAQIESFDDVDTLDKFWTFAVEALGEQAPQLLGDAFAAAAGGGFGGVAARRGMMKALMRQLGPRTTDNIRKALRNRDTGYELYNYYAGLAASRARKGTTRGARAGALASIYAQSAGETAVSLDAEGIDSPATAFAVGAAKSVLEYAPLDLLVRNLRKMTGLSGSELGKVTSRIAGQMGLEGTTEGLQTALDIVAINAHHGKDLLSFSDEDWGEIITGAAKGAIVGGGLATPGAVPPAYRAARAQYLQHMREGTGQRETEEIPADTQEFVEGLADVEATPITTREGPEVIEAQVGDFLDGRRRAVFASRADEDSWGKLREAAERSNSRVVETREGLLLADKDAAANYAALANRPRDRDAFRAELLEYTQAKEDIRDPATAQVVRTVDRNNVERISEVVDRDRVQEAVTKQQELFPEEGMATSAVDPITAQELRAAGRDGITESHRDLASQITDQAIKSARDLGKRKVADGQTPQTTSTQADLSRSRDDGAAGRDAGTTRKDSGFRAEPEDREESSRGERPDRLRERASRRDTDPSRSRGNAGVRQGAEGDGGPSTVQEGPPIHQGGIGGGRLSREEPIDFSEYDELLENQALGDRFYWETRRVYRRRREEWQERERQRRRWGEHSWNTQVTARGETEEYRPDLERLGEVAGYYGEAAQDDDRVGLERSGFGEDMGPETVAAPEWGERPYREFFSEVEELEAARRHAESITTNNVGEKQSETTRQWLEAQYPTQKISKFRISDTKNNAPRFAFEAEPKIFHDHESAHYQAELLEIAYPNSIFDIVQYPQGFALRRWEADDALKAEPDDTTRIYAKYLGKAINAGFNAFMRQNNKRAVIWARNPAGTRVPLYAPTIAQMGMEETGDHSSTTNGFLSGLATLQLKGWTVDWTFTRGRARHSGPEHTDLLDVRYDANNPHRRLRYDASSQGRPLTDSIDAELEAALAEIDETPQQVEKEEGELITVQDGAFHLAAKVEEILERHGLNAEQRRVFLQAQGLDDLIMDTELDKADGEGTDESGPRYYDEFTGEALHHPEDVVPRDAGGKRIRGTHVTRRWIEQYNRRVEAARRRGHRPARIVNVRSEPERLERRRELDRLREELAALAGRDDVTPDMLLDIAESFDGGYYAPIIGRLRQHKHVKNTQVVITENRQERRLGTHRYKHTEGHGWRSEITLNLPSFYADPGANVADTIVHEFLHAATRGAILATRPSSKVRKDFEEIRGAIQSWIDNGDNFQSLSERTATALREMAANAAEIPTYALTDKGVQNALRRIRSPRGKQSVWSKFVDAIRRMLGLSEAEGTLLEDVLTATEAAMNVTARKSFDAVVEGEPNPGTLAAIGLTPLSEAIRGVDGSAVRRYTKRVKDFLAQDLPRMLPFVFTADRELRAMGAHELADWFSQQSSSTRRTSDTPYFQGLANARNRWYAQWYGLIKEFNDTERLNTALDELSRAPEDGDPTTLSEDAQRINAFFHKYLDQYLRPRFGEIGKLNIYFPRVYDLEQAELRRGELKELLLEEVDWEGNISRRDLERSVDAAIDSILSSGGTADFNLTISEQVISPGFNSRFARRLRGTELNQKLREAGFLADNTFEVVNSYLASSTKFAEFARINGGPDGNRLKTLIDQLEPQHRERARQIIEGYMGRIGLNSDPRIVRGMSWMMVYQSYLTLMFSAVASIPDLAGPIIRSRDMAGAKQAFATLLDGFRNYPYMKERAELLGVLNERLTHQALKEAYGQFSTDSRTHKALDRLFQWNQQERLTNFSRTISATVAEQFLVTNAEKALNGDKRAQRYLRELNVTAEDIQAWDREGRPLSPDHVSRTTENVQNAIYQFIDESVLRPNASQRPLWANHPMYMLLWHLKSFFWAYGKVILGGMAREAASRYRESGDRGSLGRVGAAAEPFAIGGLMLFPLAVVARMLRQVIQYGFDDEEWPTNDEDALEFFLGRLGDAGVYGPFELLFSATRFGDDAGGVGANLAGPAFQHLYSIPEGGLTWADVKRATPGMNQLPWLNDLLKPE